MTLTPHAARAARFALFTISLAALVGCAGAPRKAAQAPVEDRSAAARPAAPAVTTPAPAPQPEAPKLPPGAENAGKPGYYTVRPGDTLIRVGLETGQNWRDLQRWNNLENPDRIEVGQVLRVVAPGQDPSSVAVRPITPPRGDSRPLDRNTAAAPGGLVVSPGAASGAGAASASAGAATAPAPAASPSPAPAPAAAPAVAAGDDDINWQWPAQGPVIAAFDDTRNKGVAIGGKPGDPVVAAADGRVVYAGSGLRGYGNLVIIKHNDNFLTAYAHNQSLAVREDQVVRRGQKIAEMGSTDADRVQLHFEVRRRGKPVDPTRFLPAR